MDAQSRMGMACLWLGPPVPVVLPGPRGTYLSILRKNYNLAQRLHGSGEQLIQIFSLKFHYFWLLVACNS